MLLLNGIEQLLARVTAPIGCLTEDSVIRWEFFIAIYSSLRNWKCPNVCLEVESHVTHRKNAPYWHK